MGLYLVFLNRDAIKGVLSIESKESIKTIFFKVQNLPYFFYVFFSSDLPVYDIYIDEDKLAELNDNLPKIGDEGGFMEKYQDAKSARFFFDGREYDVKVRYRGAGEVHWRFPKKSWKVNFSNDTLFNGMKSIDLIIPEDREFVVEALNSYRAKKLNLLSPFSGFAILRVNGRKQGIYLAYEHWGKDFLERNNVSDGANLYNDMPAANIFKQTAFWSKYNQDPISKFDNYAEMDLLLDFINNATDGEFNKDIFNLVDKENFYNWQIHSVLAESTHQENEHNCRVYFNNAIGKFQFIPWDVLNNDIAEGDTETNYMLNNIGYNVLVERILKNPEFLQERNRMLWDYVKNPVNLEDDLKIFDEAVRRTKTAFYNDALKRCSNSYFDSRVAQIRENTINTFNETKDYLKKGEVDISVYPNFYKNFEVKNDTRTLLSFDINMKSFAPLALTGLEIGEIDPAINDNFSLYYDSDKNGAMNGGDAYLGEIVYNAVSKSYKISGLDFAMHSKMEMAEDLTSKYSKRMLPALTAQKFFIRVKTPIANPVNDVKIGFSLKNYLTEDIITESRITYIDKKTFSYFDKIGKTADEFTAQYPIFRKVSKKKVYLSGIHIVAENIIIPKNLEVEIAPGTVLYFKKGVSLISYSPVKAIGTKNAPIKILAVNPAEPRGTFAVVGAQKDRSEFKYAIFENGGEAYINGIFFSGTLALHQSDVTIENCQFKYAKSDDGLNVKYANATIKNSLFEKNGSDALDLDYTTGEVLENNFFDNGGDGADISGSNILIQNNTIKNSGDKGISVGERSTPKIYNNLIENCVIGIAIKDDSQAEIADNKIIKNKTGIAAYLKKPLYITGGYAKIFRTNLLDNEQETEIDEFSRIEFYE
jgi:parallel beta-helix repeat protein